MSLATVRSSLGSYYSSLLEVANRYRYVILSVVVAALVRFVPVALAYPYPLGFDTNAYYLPAMLRGLPAPLTVLKQPALAGLLLSLSYAVYAHPFLILNLFAVALQISLAAVMYLYSRRALHLTEKQAFLVSAIFTLSLLTLRLTWDQYRMGLGLVFAISALTCLNLSAKRWQNLAIPLTVLTFLSNQLPGVLLVLTMLVHLFIGNRRSMNKLSYMVSIVAGALLLGVQEVSIKAAGSIGTSLPVSSNTFQSGFEQAFSGLGFLLFTSWPLLVASIFAFRNSFRNFEAIWFSIMVFFGFVTPLLGLVFVAPPFLYWMASFPLASMTGLVLKSGVARRLLLCMIVVTSVVAASYIVSSPLAPSPYSVLGLDYRYYIPTGYLQSTVSISQEGQLLTLIQRALSTLPANATLYLPAQFFGLAFNMRHHGDVSMVDIGEVNPWISSAFLKICTDPGAYTIWWRAGQGWYGVPTLPLNCTVIGYSGDFALYQVAVADQK